MNRDKKRWLEVVALSVTRPSNIITTSDEWYYFYTMGIEMGIGESKHKIQEKKDGR